METLIKMETGQVPMDRQEDLRQLEKIAVHVAEQTRELGEKYLQLCLFIREKQITPDGLSEVLYGCGFRKQRIAEIKRVCFTSQVIFEEFQRRLIGFKVALERARSEEPSDATHRKQKTWCRLYKVFDRLAVKGLPSDSFYQGNGNCFAAWPVKDFSDEARKTYKFRGWRVTVERVSTTKAKKSSRTKEKL